MNWPQHISPDCLCCCGDGYRENWGWSQAQEKGRSVFKIWVLFLITLFWFDWQLMKPISSSQIPLTSVGNWWIISLCLVWTHEPFVIFYLRYPAKKRIEQLWTCCPDRAKTPHQLYLFLRDRVTLYLLLYRHAQILTIVLGMIPQDFYKCYSNPQFYFICQFSAQQKISYTNLISPFSTL